MQKQTDKLEEEMEIKKEQSFNLSEPLQTQTEHHMQEEIAGSSYTNSLSKAQFFYPWNKCFYLYNKLKKLRERERKGVCKNEKKIEIAREKREKD